MKIINFKRRDKKQGRDQRVHCSNIFYYNDEHRREKRAKDVYGS